MTDRMLWDYNHVHIKSSKRETVKGKLGYKLGFYQYVKDHAILENDYYDRNYGIEDNESVFKIKVCLFSSMNLNYFV